MIPEASHALFRRLCDEATSIVLTTHVHPDGDAIGSQYGLARFLLSRGKQVRVINRDPTPDLPITTGAVKYEVPASSSLSAPLTGATAAYAC